MIRENLSGVNAVESLARGDPHDISGKKRRQVTPELAFVAAGLCAGLTVVLIVFKAQVLSTAFRLMVEPDPDPVLDAQNKEEHWRFVVGVFALLAVGATALGVARSAL